MRALVGNDSLQKLQVSVPRIVYISTLCEVEADMTVFQAFRRVERHLPHNKKASHVYEVTMPEHVYNSNQWTSKITPKHRKDGRQAIFESIYESSTPTHSHILVNLGALVRLSPEAAKRKFSK